MLGRFSCAAPQLTAFSSQVFITQYHSPPLHLFMTLFASIERRSILHLPQLGLQHRIHSYGSLVVIGPEAAAARFFELRWRFSYASLQCRRRTQTRRCLLVRWSIVLSGVDDDSYSSSGAEQRARSGSVLFMEQYHRGGSLRASTTPRRRLHFFFGGGRGERTGMGDNETTDIRVRAMDGEGRTFAREFSRGRGADFNEKSV